MLTAKEGSTVTVHYIGTLDSGRIFSSATAEEPLTFTVGRNEVFPTLEHEVLTMREGETRNFVVPCADAYGPRLKSNLLKLDRSHFPPEKPVRVGQKLSIEFGTHGQRVMMVTDVNDSDVTLDGNHPLCGHDLTFALKLVKVEQ